MVSNVISKWKQLDVADTLNMRYEHYRLSENSATVLLLFGRLVGIITIIAINHRERHPLSRPSADKTIENISL